MYSGKMKRRNILCVSVINIRAMRDQAALKRIAFEAYVRILAEPS